MDIRWMMCPSRTIGADTNDCSTELRLVTIVIIIVLCQLNHLKYTYLGEVLELVIYGLLS